MDQNQSSESEMEKSGTTENDILQLFQNELKDYPQVLKFIQKLQELVDRQRKLLYKYHEKFKQTNKEMSHIGIQTNAEEIINECLPIDDKGVIDINEFKKEIVQAAHTAVQQTGFVYEPVSGLYYDYKTGYYYNSELGLYYDGATSSYYYYNEQENKFIFHSQAQQVPTGAQTTKSNKNTIQQQKNKSDNLAKAIDNFVREQESTSGPKQSISGSSSQLAKINPSESLPLSEQERPILPDSDMLSDVSSNSDLLEDLESEKNKTVETRSKKRNSEEISKEDGELSSDESESVSSEKMTRSTTDNVIRENEPAQKQDPTYKSSFDYYNSEEYRAYYEKYCKSVTVEYSKTPISYDPNSEQAKKINPALRTEEYEIANAWPPCLRIIVKETSVKGLQSGTLFIVTYLGGTVGREGEHAVLIPDINISKHHAKIVFTSKEDTKDDPTQGYMITDLGSRNGTYLDNTRLSVALQESEPHLMKHGSELRIGGSKLLIHIHDGRNTCDECEPGLLMSSNKGPTSKIDLTVDVREKRQTELKRLRKKFGLDKTATASVAVGSGYEDRAEIRRQTVGSHVEGEKTHVVTVNESISNENKGFQMLSKMGWKSGQTLGKDELNSSALIEPIIPQQYAKKAGLGSSTGSEPVLTSQEERKKKVWQKVRARYNEIDGDKDS